jgi:hypothetical protein
MKITLTELEGLTKAIFAATESSPDSYFYVNESGGPLGKLSSSFAADFMDTMRPALDSIQVRIDSCGDSVQVIELPLQFLGIYRKWAATQDRTGLDEMLLHAEQFNENLSRSNDMNRQDFLKDFSRLDRSTKSAHEDLVKARGRQDDWGMERALCAIRRAMKLERRMAINTDPELREKLECLQRAIATGDLRKLADEKDSPIVRKAATPGIAPSDAFGTGLFLAADVSQHVFVSSQKVGDYRDLDVLTLSGARMNWSEASSQPRGIWVSPTYEGRALAPSDPFISGGMVDTLANTLIIEVEGSREWFADVKNTSPTVMDILLSEGHAGAVDRVAFSGSGIDDLTSATQVGLFNDTSISAVVGAQNAIGGLTRDDFLLPAATIDTSALRRDPRFYLNHAFILKLMKIRDGANFLLRTPLENDGDYSLAGFPCTFTSFAPGTDAPGQAVAAFGSPQAYLVALHEDIQIGLSDGQSSTVIFGAFG